MKTKTTDFKKKLTRLPTFFSLFLLCGTYYGQSINTLTFSFTGAAQTFVVPSLCVNQLTLEVWGAEGGGFPISANSASGNGGKGGYSYGVLTVAPGDVLSIYVGGFGQSSTTGPAAGGFNGGADGYASSASEPGNGGGGATDIRLNGQSFNNRVIVAGGGGGGGEDAGDQVGHGGGLTGSGYASYDASQTAPGSGGALGIGGSTGLGDGGGGGGGYYGGGSLVGASVGADTQGGGGGSGYIGGLSNGITINGQTSMPDPSGGTMIGRSGNGFARIIYDATSPLVVTASPSVICEGESAVLTAAGATYTWAVNGSTSSSISVSPNVTTTYSVTGMGSGTLTCFGTATIQVGVNPLPDLSAIVQPTLLCVGKSATITASGANTYTWGSGPTGTSVMVNPSSTTVYTVLGTDGFGCTNSVTANVPVSTNSISVSSNTTICEGDQLDLSASGAISYTWNTGSLFSATPVSPAITTVYSVTGTDQNECLLSNTVAVTVDARPNVAASANKAIICKNEAVSLSATGANSYTWSSSVTGTATGAALNVVPNIDVLYTYTVTGSGPNGCTGMDVITLQVNRCTGITENSAGGPIASVFPNPGRGLFTLESVAGATTIEVSDCTGRAITTFMSEGEKTEIDLSGLANGLYYLKIRSGSTVEVLKAVKY
jgi:hypothetical protein